MENKTSKNAFWTALNGHNTLTENGALSNKSTGSNFADQFGKAGSYRHRDYSDVASDQSLLWDENPEAALRFIFYLRMITRKTKINNGFVTEKVQNGQGVRDESFKRLLWVAVNHPNDFYNNIWLLPIIGSWKDLWTLMYLDKTIGTKAINHEVIFALIAQGMKMKEHVELIQKFMPRIKSQSKCVTDWTKITNDLAKEFAAFMKWSWKDYNKFKANLDGWQQKACSRRFDEIEFSTIPGRALSNIVSSNFIEKHDLGEKYGQWIDEQPVAKYKGYVYELYRKFAAAVGNRRYGIPSYKEITLNKQFKGLVDLAKQNSPIRENVLCAIDTSPSMQEKTSFGTTAYDICISLGAFFSSLNTGAFHNKVVAFSSTSETVELGEEFCDKMRKLVTVDSWGSTNLQSVVDELIRVRRRNPEIPLEDYPTTILVVSDMQFDPTGKIPPYLCDSRYHGGNVFTEEQYNTNYEEIKSKLEEAFPKEFVDSMKFIWWDCISRKKDFPAQITDGGCYFLSGFDGSIISMLIGMDGESQSTENASNSQPISMEEMVSRVLSQEILMQVKIA